ncbi:hypothetical protein MOF23_07705 [Bacillus inaquosorum]|uniref:hypothetical protein n=1 Tax=Bacillus inaquosorum TaxID=483913 RepID=UPI00227E002E|nr:hypothetical protein [Bacillus inaquosorum]MCY9308854.1 hypothetical protein [Bacillus inaquosorum]
MNYIELMDETIDLFNSLNKSIPKKEKQALVESVKDNEIVQKVISLVKDKAVHVENLIFPESVEKNEGRIRLGNFLNFVETVAKIDEFDEALIHFLFRNTDKEEQKMYEAILKSVVSLIPDSKEEKVKAKKENKKEDAPKDE